MAGYDSKSENRMVVSIAAIVATVILGGIGAGAFTAHENNIKSRKVATVCAEHGGTFRQGGQGEMTCDGIKK
ncbi:hypothetical protein SEA_BILLNYE_202 [Streptomyces phage BillNye]|uniref:Uncharacterized protein n=2 Tax=Wilnyevirus billnye TaxID=2560486 RepID=A0A2L1IW29_9CAUD|nr:hypothetical protein FDJ30_gp059 [Streptomyces phage BillNye]AVD99374.1 hypothetical protein SEA_BILLNYE_202 [Streptomyces phage BillNye]QBZ72456.1 hypothetical protein SEA_CIRCINUS_202 [Streptomyces phage Circinus]